MVQAAGAIQAAVLQLDTQAAAHWATQVVVLHLATQAAVLHLDIQVVVQVAGATQDRTRVPAQRQPTLALQAAIQAVAHGATQAMALLLVTQAAAQAAGEAQGLTLLIPLLLSPTTLLSSQPALLVRISAVLARLSL